MAIVVAGHGTGTTRHFRTLVRFDSEKECGSVDNPSRGADLADTRKPSKEYRARIFVKLTDDIPPQPMLTRVEVESHVSEALKAGDADSPIISVVVDDPRNTRTKRY